MLGVTFRCERTPMAEPAPRPIDDTDDDVPSAEAMGLPLVGVVPAYADRSEHFARYAELRGSGAVEVSYTD